MKRPVVQGCCLWISGYVLAMYTELPWLTWMTSALLLAALVIIYALRLPGRQALGALLLVVIAYGYYQGTDQRNISALPLAQQGQIKDAGSEVTLLGRFASPVTIDGDKASFTMEAASVRFQDTDAFPLGGESVQVSLRLMEQAQQAVASGWRRGDALTLTGTLRSPSPASNFGGFDYRRYLRLHHTHWLLSAKGVDQAQVQPAAARFSVAQLLRWNDELRAALSRRMDGIFPASQAGFMKSMLIGLTDDLDPDRFQQFSELGLTHILAISGLNIAVFLGVCIWLMRRFRMAKETYLLICMCLLPFYVLITGASPSIVRAGLMSMIALYAARRGGMKDVLHILAIAAWGMLLWNPYFLLDVSFQLSFLVTLGLILGVQRVTDLIKPYLTSPTLRNTLAITLVSQSVSFPVSIYYFNQFSLFSWLANAVLVPVISMIVFPAGLVALTLGLIYMPLGRSIGWLISWLNEAIFWITDKLQQLPYVKMIWPTPSLPWIVCYYGLLVFIYFLWYRSHQTLEHELPIQLDYTNSKNKRNVNPKIVLSLTCAGFLLLLWIGYTPDRFLRNGLVQFIDVGQGDAILIRTPYGRQLLIDGGGTLSFRKAGEEWKNRKDPYEVGRKLLVPLLKKRGVHSLDLVVLTHEDADHSGGLQAVFEQIPVKQFLFNGTFKSGGSMTTMFTTLLQKKVPLLPAHVGDWIEIDPQTKLQILYPLENIETHVEIVKEQNARSVVFLLDMQGTRWLFTGDMEKESEATVLAYLHEHPDLVGGSSTTNHKIDVLKVAHHGSKTSTTPEWLAFWNPTAAVISVGAMNTYGHPSPEIIDHLLNVKAGVFRTDQMGEIQMEVRKDGIFTRLKGFN
ncbi:DNA internalization-related competence protein ComEC/Rec2 [Paenibacillus pectinilyticus]|uniref:DNA internalization-related competence protein ComEC/Rec2 n=1 Tax=Paenibacillus pectinilyticus TaxID=512399 RepID=A0A1C1A9B2_9BACL|nr:DNA internalization-related competence protein ComEC/Rec2 [Paenibacillus pectinilyticus]OCT17192.1 DNA internalization-related competence protein ComEC/Rec2 [Paenibacillus pectinilyticus]